jgi:hypothetical protein
LIRKLPTFQINYHIQNQHWLSGTWDEHCTWNLKLKYYCVSNTMQLNNNGLLYRVSYTHGTVFRNWRPISNFLRQTEHFMNGRGFKTIKPRAGHATTFTDCIPRCLLTWRLKTQ